MSSWGTTVSGRHLAGGRDGHLPDADHVVAVAGEQGLAGGGPGHGQALGRVGAGGAGHLRQVYTYSIM